LGTPVGLTLLIADPFILLVVFLEWYFSRSFEKEVKEVEEKFGDEFKTLREKLSDANLEEGLLEGKYREYDVRVHLELDYLVKVKFFANPFL
jgi:hypothetical protein